MKTIPVTKTRRHSQLLNIRDEKSLKEDITRIFESHNKQEQPHQRNIIIDLYKMVFPDWDSIEKIKGYPECGPGLWEFICLQFQEFDKKHHPDVIPGGGWMNVGFSVNSKMPPWEISLKNCQAIIK